MTRSAWTCPLKRQTVSLSRGLIRVHQRLRGELSKAHVGEPCLFKSERARVALRQVEGLLAFLGTDFDADALREIRVKRQGRFRSSLGMPTLNIARGLIRLHMRLRGEIEKNRSSEQTYVPVSKARRLMQAIDELMPILGIDFDPTRLRSIRTRRSVGPFEYGGLRHGILTTLRRANRWMSYEEIATSLLASRQVSLARERYRHFLQKLREAVLFLRRRGRLDAESALGIQDGLTRQRWRIRARPIPV
jgi:hypothetical protein